MGLPFLVLGASALAIVALVVFLDRRREARALRALAARQRLNVAPDDLMDLPRRYHALRLIRRGHNRFAWNLLYGTADEGLLSLFCYRCDLGFGVRQTQRAWWVAVVETTRRHAPWLVEGPPGPDPDRAPRPAPAPARPSAPAVPPPGDPGRAVESLPEEVSASDRPSDPPQAVVADLAAALPPRASFEVRHHLVAVAAPCDRAALTPQRVLDAARRLARRLAPPAPADAP